MLWLTVFLSGWVQAEGALHFNVVSLEVSVEQAVDNNVMQAWLTVRHEHKQAAQAANKVNLDMQWALAISKANKSLKARTEHYSTQPKYDGRNVVGWVVSQQLLLESENFEQLSQLVTELQKKLQLSRLAFTTTKSLRDATDANLTQQALQAFRNKAQLVSDSLGMEQYEIVDLQIANNQQFRPVPRVRAEAITASFSSKELAVEAGTSTLKVIATGRIQLR
jgi:predicted secreted protein